MPRIFISYRRDDSAGFAGRIYEHLSEHFGEKQLFMDISAIAPGDDFVKVIEDAVGDCDALIAVIGKRWLSISDASNTRRLDNPNDFVRLEITTALARGIRVIPVLVEGAAMPTAVDLPEPLHALTRRNALEISHARFKYDVDVLIETLDQMLPHEGGMPIITPTGQQVANKMFNAIALMMLCWALPLALFSFAFPFLGIAVWETSLLINAIWVGIAAIGTGLVLRWCVPALRMPHLFLLLGGWLVASIPVTLSFWSEPLLAATLIALGGFIGGLGVGFMLRIVRPLLRPGQILIIAITWCLSALIGVVLVDWIGGNGALEATPTITSAVRSKPLIAAVIGLVMGLLGGGETLWQVLMTPANENPPAKRP